VNPPVIGYVYQVARYCQEIMFKRSTDNGGTWPDSVIVSHYDSAGSQWAVIGIDSCFNIHTGWYDYKYSPYSWTGDIFYRASRDTGCSWQPIDSLTTHHRAAASDILINGNNLHLVWEDDRNDFDENFEIYYRMSRDLGQTWVEEVRLTDALNWSCNPSLASDSNYLHLFWFDLRDDPNNIVGEIYYKRKDLSWRADEQTGLPWPSAFEVEVCPNPFRERLEVKCRSGKEGIQVKIFDVSGRVVAYGTMKDEPGCRQMFVKGLPGGVYLVMVETGDGCAVVKKAVNVD
jgi:hypothetical protein